MLKLKGITKDYITSSETVSALKGVDISFRQKEFVSILGPSGCGKTTLLNIIGGLDHYTSGDLVIGGRSTKSYTDRDWDVYRNHRIGFIFQSYNLIPHQTVLGNVELALTIAGVDREERAARAKTALDRVGLAGQYYKKPNQLSGGQCQRVAIARALVNDPEILLADEPTGALDTVTSLQIMDLIKEISGERLVIMVTHNPEIADAYSSRIIRLLDGRVTEDTNPFTEAEEEAECKLVSEAEAKADAELIANISDEREKKKLLKKKKERAKMSLFTAFMLSAKNLISKRGRTAMVGFAGSIGIIGIALVLAFSSGINGYIYSMQDDLLSGNPISITETAYDLEALTGMMQPAGESEKTDKKDGYVYISSIVEYLAKMSKDISETITENNITPKYIEFLKNMPEERYNAMLFNYGINPAANIFTDYKLSASGEAENVSVKNIVDIYTAVLKSSDYASYADSIEMLCPSFVQAVDNIDYINSQYELIAGSKIATEKNEIMLVLNHDDELSDLLLAMLGYYTQDEFEEIVVKATEDNYDKALYKEAFTYEELLGKKFTYYPDDTVFSADGMGYKYNHNSKDFDKSKGVELKVVGILTAKENVNYGSLTSGVYYTKALTDYMLDANRGSKVVDYLEEMPAQMFVIPVTNSIAYGIKYDFGYRSWTGEDKTDGSGIVGPSILEALIGSMSGSMTGGGSGGSMDFEALKESFIRTLAGNDLSNEILIYPLTFDEKNLVTEYLDSWNDEKLDLTFGNTTLKAEERTKITYTDALEIVISMITTMIDIVTYALVAFTSVSLVVSTVMIGIITYVSVVERIKEIGVIRALGGRKKDVSHLFNAETFIIGMLAGLFGVGVTYIISFIVNLILAPIINYSRIAALPIGMAVILVALSVGLTLISGLIPSKNAARRDPVVALRTE